jgi:hypothetical protein
MVMNEVKSSAIKAIGYEPRTHELAITFTSGQTYLYQGFSLLDFAEFMNAPSKGVHFFRQIKPYFNGLYIS